MNEYAQWNVKGHRNTLKEHCCYPLLYLYHVFLLFVCIPATSVTTKPVSACQAAQRGCGTVSTWDQHTLFPYQLKCITSWSMVWKWWLNSMNGWNKILRFVLRIWLCIWYLHLRINTLTYIHVHISCTHNMFMISIPNCDAWLYEAKMKVMTHRWQ